MVAHEIETGLDELFSDASMLTPAESSALGIVRGMLWKVQESEYNSFKDSFTGRNHNIRMICERR